MLSAKTKLPNSACCTCSDCGGTGKYVGLSVVELCSECSGRGWLSPYRIDVIKSTEVERRLFTLVLERRDYEVRTFDRVHPYLTQLDAPLPDAIIIGWGPRACDGLELDDELLRRGLEIPIVIASSREVNGAPPSVAAILDTDDVIYGVPKVFEAIGRAVRHGHANRLSSSSS